MRFQRSKKPKIAIPITLDGSAVGPISRDIRLTNSLDRFSQVSSKDIELRTRKMWLCREFSFSTC